MPGVTAAEVVFDSVAVWAALVDPTVVLAKVKELGDRVTDPAEAPVPESGRVSVPMLSGRLTCAVRVPDAEGVNLTLIVHPVEGTVAPTPGQVPVPPNAKSLALVPVIVKLALTVTVVPLLGVSVDNSTALVVPTVWLGNVSGLGESVTEPVPEEAPVPLKLTVEVVADEIRVAVRVPVAVGLKVTLIVQLPPAASELPQVLV